MSQSNNKNISVGHAIFAYKKWFIGTLYQILNFIEVAAKKDSWIAEFGDQSKCKGWGCGDILSCEVESLLYGFTGYT